MWGNYIHNGASNDGIRLRHNTITTNKTLSENIIIAILAHFPFEFGDTCEFEKKLGMCKTKKGVKFN